MVLALPARPAFVSDAERVVWEALAAELRDEDVLLHSVRLTDAVDGDVEIDLLVLMPDLGAAIVEVKGGHLTYCDGLVHQTGASGTHAVDPAGQAAKGARALRRFVERQPTWSAGPLRADWLVAFPYTHLSADLSPDLPERVVIDARTLAAGDAAGKVFDRLRENVLRHGSPPVAWAEAATATLVGTHDTPGEIRARVAMRLREADRLTEQQARLLDLTRRVPRFEVTGAAGTGKTWLAIEQARRWALAGERVCLVAYTRGVIEAIRGALADDAASGGRPAFVGTFHHLAAQWGVVPDGPLDDEFWLDTAPAAMRQVAAGLPAAERFTAFVVDEGQDFADSWWPALLAGGPPDSRIAVFRDDEQAVFSQRRGRPEVDLVPLVLDENLRNSSQIVDTFRPLIRAPLTCRSGPGFGVEFVPCTPDGVIVAADDVVVDLVERRGWLPEHVALLTTKHRHPVQVELDADKAAYWAGLWSTDDVFYGTVAGFKGLERSAVIVAVDGFHDGVEPASVLYAGMSRARDLLVVVAPEDVVEQIDRKLARRLRRGSQH